MDLLSLLAILQNETLHFTHISDLYRYDPHEGTGGLLINVVNDPIPPRMSVVPPDLRFEEQNRKVEEQTTEIQTLKERLEKLEQLMTQHSGGVK